MDPLNTIILSDPMVILAEHGFFADNSSNFRSSSSNSSIQTTLHRSDPPLLLRSLVCKKKYSIKRVVMATQSTVELDRIIDSLLGIEVECWHDLRIDRDQIRLRLSSNICWIAVVDDEVVGVLYCQLIDSVSPIMDGSITFACQENIHTAHGHILQLLGVAVLPSYAQLQIGNALRDFVIQLASHTNQITSVIAMTRCSSSSVSVDHYLQKIHSKPPQDPTLLFHSHGGAAIVSAIPQYRPDDHANYGYAIMIRYNTEEEKEEKDSSVNESVMNYYESVNDDISHIQQDYTSIEDTDTKVECVLTLTEILPIIHEIVGITHHKEEEENDDLGDRMSYADKSFMHLGLDSLSMMEMRNRLNVLYHKYLVESLGVSATTTTTTSTHQLSPTLLFDFPTPKQLVSEFNRQLHIHLRRAKASKSSIDSPASVALRETSVADASLLPSQPSSSSLTATAVASASSASLVSSFAVLGMSCRFPGGCNNPDLFHHKLCDGLDAVTAIPTDWDWNARTKHVSLLNESDAEVFDPGYFQLNSKEAELMDPHQRLVLELCHEALIDARILGDDDDDDDDDDDKNKGKGKGKRRMMDTMTIGVFVGLCNNDWLTSSSSLNDVSPYSSTGTAMSATANRVSFLLGLTGPSMVIDTACSSSLTAVHVALNSIRCGDCDVAVIAAADLLISDHCLKIREEAGMLSSSGKNRTFDMAADGYIRGEGGGAIVIRSLVATERDIQAGVLSSRTTIHAVICGSAVNQDGRSASLTAPNGSAQRRLLRMALANARIQASEVTFIETHGTGTPLGDPIEWGAIRDVFLMTGDGNGNGGDGGKDCGKGNVGGDHDHDYTGSNIGEESALILGAVKTNIGHLEGAAGMAGLIKAINCLRYREVPKNLHLDQLNPNMIMNDDNADDDVANRRPHFPSDTIKLPTTVIITGTDDDDDCSTSDDVCKLYAGVTSLGSGGTNAHVIIHSYGRHRDAVAVVGMDREKEGGEGEVAGTETETGTGKVMSGSDSSTSRSPAGDMISMDHHHHHDQDHHHKISFNFAGQGVVYPHMGRSLFEAEPVFRDAIMRCSHALEQLLQPTLVEVMYLNHPNSIPLINTQPYSHLAIVALEIAIAHLWRCRGIEPHAVTGHSLGEYAMAVTAGVFTEEDAMRIVYLRSQCLLQWQHEQYDGNDTDKSIRDDDDDDDSSKGVMVAIRRSEEQALAAIAACESKASSLLSSSPSTTSSDSSLFISASIASIQGPMSVVLSGRKDSIALVLSALDVSSSSCKYLAVDYAYHSNLIIDAAKSFENRFQLMIDEGFILAESSSPSSAASAASATTITTTTTTSAESKPYLPIISCQTGGMIDPNLLLSPQYWARQMVSTVLFMNCIQSLRRDTSISMMIEIGPSTTLTDITPSCLRPLTHHHHHHHHDNEEDVVLVASLDKDNDAMDHFNSSLSTVRVAFHTKEYRASTSPGGVIATRGMKCYRPIVMRWRQRNVQRRLTVTDYSDIKSNNSNSNSNSNSKNDYNNNMNDEIVTSNVKLSLSIHRIVYDAVVSVLPPHSLDTLSRDQNISLVAMGVDSLASLSIRNTIMKQLNLTQLSNTVVLQHPTIGRLVQHLQTLCSTSSNHDDDNGDNNDDDKATTTRANVIPTILDDENRNVDLDLPPSSLYHSLNSNSEMDVEFPASCMQQGMLYHHIADPEELRAFIETFRWTIASNPSYPLDIDIFHQSWIKVIEFFGTLRSTFDVYATPQPLQQVWKVSSIKDLLYAKQSTWFSVIDIRDRIKGDSHPRVQASSSSSSSGASIEDDKQQAIHDEIYRQRRLIDDLSIPLLLHVAVLLTSDPSPGIDLTDTHTVLFTIHHGLMDGFSVQLLLDKLSYFYSELLLLLHNKTHNDHDDVKDNRTTASSACTTTIRDMSYAYFSSYEKNKILTNQQMKAYWSNRFNITIDASITSSTNTKLLPTIAIDLHDEDVVRVRCDILEEECIMLSQAAAALDVTLPALFHTCWSIIYSRLVDRRYVIYGNTCSGRSAAMKGILDVMGPVINTVLLNYSVEEDMGIDHLVHSIHQLLIDSGENESYPLAEIQKLIRSNCSHNNNAATISSLSKAPVFNAIFDFQTQTWDKVLLFDPIDNDNMDKLQLRPVIVLKDSLLIDRIGCPLSMRILSSNGNRFIQMHATSESSYYTRESLNQMLYSMKKLLQFVSSSVLPRKKNMICLIPTVKDCYAHLVDTDDDDHHQSTKESSELFPPPLSILISSDNNENDPDAFHKAAIVSPIRPDVALTDDLLHESFLMHASMQKNGDTAPRTAVVYCDDDGNVGVLSYGDLLDVSERAAAQLIEHVRTSSVDSSSHESSRVVAIIMEKGWEQVAAVLAVHRLQCAYLPMDFKSWSEHRIRQVLELSEAIAVYTQPHLLSLLSSMGPIDVPIIAISRDLPEASSDQLKAIMGLSRCDPFDVGYLIYTSGSTGVPKGVSCHHRGAMNTIHDLNSLFDVSRDDRVLALSSLSFDLSVYDIFGLLSAGGTVVIPSTQALSPPDPSIWHGIIQSEGITLWNTVPAFMELLVSQLESTDSRLPASLRLIYLSGDWIPITLPRRIKALSDNPNLRIISMGGATEASIWSNMYEIDVNGSIDGSGIPEGWSSIPYGRPMRNQRMYVLNDRMEHCDVWVTGSLFIGGVGVAHGYYKNPDRTAYQFVRHPTTDEMLFRTGDLGRVRPEGLLEILGREDSQVKVNGFRIELGEIEKVLTEYEDVSSAALAVHNNALCAYLVLRSSHSARETTDQVISDLKILCKEKLTEYMIPKHFSILGELPLSPNGKLQREKLPICFDLEDETENYLSALAQEEDHNDVVVYTEKELILIDVWTAVLSISRSSFSLDSNFFSLGGDSLRSIQVVAAAKKSNLIVTVPQIFNNPTIRSLSLVVSSLHRNIGPEVLGSTSRLVESKPIFTIESDEDSQFVEYPMIGITQAHFVGLHTSSFAKSGMTPQVYFEFFVGADATSSAATTDAEKGSSHAVDDELFTLRQVDVPALEAAFNQLVHRHDTFRSVVTRTGSMKVVDKVPDFKIEHVYSHDEEDYDEDNNDGDKKKDVKYSRAQENAEFFRNTMMDNGPTVHDWPLFEVRVTHLSATSSLIHLSLSLFLMDAMSDLVFRQELSIIYRSLLLSKTRASSSSPSLLLPNAPRIRFRDYCIALDQKLHSSNEYKAARKYWLGRLSSLSTGPELPTMPTTALDKNSKISIGKFVNYHRWLSVVEWKRAQRNCSYHSVTMPAVLLTAYAVVLYKWGSRDRFLINILQCLRHQVHEDVNKLVGNCTSPILCDIDLRPTEGKDDSKVGISFRVAIQRVSQEVSRNLEHSCMSGVEVMQELNRIHGKTFKAVAPFIFTTPIGVEKGNKEVVSMDWMFKEKFFSERVPHTACVNVIKADPSGTACASIDIVDGLFYPEVVDGIYRTYSSVLDVICSDNPLSWHKSLSDIISGGEANLVPPIRPDVALTDDLLHESFLMHASIQKNGDTAPRTAVIYYDDDGNVGRLSYGDLLDVSERSAAQLIEHVRNSSKDSSSNESSRVVAIIMEKGWEQVAAVLAVHRLQCAYLPMDFKSWSEHRIRQVLELSEAIAVYTQPHLLSLLSSMGLIDVPIIAISRDLPEALSDQLETIASLPRCDPFDVGYLIYTSGSTGIPKGVSCHHRGAMNTIHDLNSLFDVSRDDRVLALSSLSFDLSVYDIFGLLSAGGTVVIPSTQALSPPDPSIWHGIIQSEGITLWNTVPAFMELLVNQLEGTDSRLPASLRLIYLSGDWIPITLPRRIKALSDNPNLRIISMGGATEASIWSNMYEIDVNGSIDGSGIPEGWSSIPYGRPMRNQRMYVLNDRMEHCDVWVTGSLFIGGVGVAHGYYKNPDRTAYQFVRHPTTDEMLFRTGDLGRVRPEGLLEILGREDSQVKVNGFRIELGEIEKVLTEYEDVSSAALAVHNNALCAYLVLRSSHSARETTDQVISDLKILCKEKLTEYMIPKHFSFLEELPLSSNGKLQREKLLSPMLSTIEYDHVINTRDNFIQPSNDRENSVLTLFSTILNVSAGNICCQYSTFFESGGNSLSSIQLLLSIRNQFKVVITIQEFFVNPTVLGICSLISSGLQQQQQQFDNNDGKIEEEGTSSIANTTAASSHAYNTTTTAKINFIQELQLQKSSSSTSGTPPLILFNPAGASGLCYIPLLKAMDLNTAVYVLDDGVMLSGNLFQFESIEHVAATCLPVIESILKRHHDNTRDNHTDFDGSNISADDSAVVFNLGGWSYGGVVAVAVAKLIQNTPAYALPNKLVVNKLILIDSSLRASNNESTTQIMKDDDDDESINISENIVKIDEVNDVAESNSNITSEDKIKKMVTEKFINKNDDDIATQTNNHFKACIELLKKHHQRPSEHKPLTCPIYDVRPSEDSTYGCPITAIEELTTGKVTRRMVAGNHWTMLFNEHAISISEILKSYLNE